MEIIQDNNSKDSTIIKITYRDLTIVAFLYNFVANNSESLSVEKKLDFYNYMKNSKYHETNVTYMFLPYESTPNMRLDECIENLKSGGKVKAINLKYLFDYYKELPEYIINRTLTEEALNLIGVDKKDLTLKNTTVDYYDSIKVYAMGARDAIEKSRKCLETYGYKNIRITSSFYLGMKDDHLYRVSYRANKYFESLDEEKTKIKVLGKNFKDIQ